MSTSSTFLAVSGLAKAYGPVTVLRDVGFALARGEVHALVGENGAGKSTLCRIIAGLTTPDTGTMILGGTAYAPRNRHDAVSRGVRMVMQELNLVRTLTVGESIFIDNLPHCFGWIDRQRLHRQAREALARVGLADLDPARLIGSVGVGQQQLVEIAAGLSRRCDLLILDEPTAALTDPEIAKLFEQITALKAAGTTVLYISHRLDEIRRVADHVTVLRDGRLIDTRAVKAWPMNEIVTAMVGRELTAPARRERRSPGAVALRVRGLCCGATVRDVSFEVRRGEILGFAGLMGSGRTETMRAIFGADRPDAGEIRLREEIRPTKIRSPRDAVRAGLALLTEDRKEEGLLLPLSIRTNLTLPSLHRFKTRTGWVRRAIEHREAEGWTTKLAVRCRDAEQQVSELSGGNQQKVVIAKWLLRDCEVLILDEPTRGIDAGARFDIYELLRALAAQGKAIIVVSSDLPELLGLADRIAVMSAGRLAATFDRESCSQAEIMSAALSGYKAATDTNSP